MYDIAWVLEYDLSGLTLKQLFLLDKLLLLFSHDAKPRETEDQAVRAPHIILKRINII